MANKNPNLFNWQRAGVIIAPSALIIGVLLFSSPMLAQEDLDLEDSIEAELDQISQPESEGASAEANTENSADSEFDIEAAAAAPATQPAAQPAAQPVTSEPNPSEVTPPSTATSFDSGSGDSPNLEFEQRLFKIFGNAQPVSPMQWQELAGSRQTEVYAVQPGDTLWDISQTMFGDGFFWSKLWAENRGLENPHSITVGHGIKFMSGNESTAPSISVANIESAAPLMAAAKEGQALSIKDGAVIAVNSADSSALDGAAPIYREKAMEQFTPEELAKGDVAELEELVPTPEIPPPGKISRPLLRKLPPSFVVNKIVNYEAYDKTGLDVGERPVFTRPATVVPNSYLADQLPNGIGKVNEIEMGDTFASVGQNVFVKMNSDVNIGQKFSVVYPKGKIKDRQRGEIGPVMEVGGTIEIAENLGSGLYRASVTMNLNPIRLGSIVLNEELPKVSFGRTGSRTGVTARIIGGEFDEVRRQFGESSVVYLDGGSNQSINKNDILPILARRGDRRPGTKIPNWRKPIGLLKVVKVEETVATAFVLEASEEILPGDVTGGEMPTEAGEVKVDDTTQDKIDIEFEDL